MTDEQKLKKALMKKALGYQVSEVVEEFSVDENGAQKLNKKKVTRKHVASDTSALKILIEKFFPNLELNLSEMTDQQLEDEREKILQLLKEEENAN